MRLRSLALFCVLTSTAACGARSSLFAPEDGEGGGGIGGGPTHVHDKPTCSDVSKTSVYVVTDTLQIYGYDPPNNTFDLVGVPECAFEDLSPNAFSMAVDRAGHAYIEIDTGNGGVDDWHIDIVDLKTRDCEYGFPAQAGFARYGMGFAANDDGRGETLFVAANSTARLATVDVKTGIFTPVGRIHPNIGSNGAELTGTHDEKLYAFGIGNPNARLADIDKDDGEVLDQHELPIGGINVDAWAFAYWGGKFYFFTSQGMSLQSTVTQYDLDTGQIDDVGLAPGRIVGAGVSTCAPE